MSKQYTPEEIHESFIRYWKNTRDMWQMLFLLEVRNKNHIRVNKYYAKYSNAQAMIEQLESER